MGAALNSARPSQKQNISKENCMLQVATINCHFRLPSTFSNLHNLFATSEPIDGYQKKRKTVDIYCINL